MKHSNTVGGSTAERFIACPGSMKLSRKAPPQKSSSYADEGTMLHHILQTILEGKFSVEQLIGWSYEGHVFTEELRKEMIDPALEAWGILQKGYGGDFEYEIEMKVRSILPGSFGTVDVFAWNEDTVLLVDWKFGRGVKVPVEDNKQALFYASAARHHKKHAYRFENSKVVLAIVQPAFGGLDTWEIDGERLAHFDMDLEVAYNRARFDEPPLNTGDHCKFCPAKATCPAINSELGGLLVIAEDISADLSDTLAKIAAIEPWLKGIKQDAHKLMEEGGKIPGWKLVAKRKIRKWARDDSRTSLELGVLGLESTDIWKSTLVSPAQAEKLLDKGQRKKLDKLIEAKSSGTTLAAASDPRPQISDLKTAIENIGASLK